MDRISQFRKRSRANTDVGKFFTTTEQVRILLEDLRRWVECLKTKHGDIIAIPISNDNRNQHVEEINSKIKNLSSVVRSKLKVIEKSIQDSEKQLKDVDPPGGTSEEVSLVSVSMSTSTQVTRSSASFSPLCRYTPAALRIRKTQIASLSQQFSEIMTDYQIAQVNYRDRIRMRLKRQLEITNSCVSEEAIDNWIDEGKNSVFTKSIIFDPKVVEDVTARHNDLLKLEKSIRDLNELFKDLAQHVELQGHTLDNIEQNVNSTAEFAEEAVRHVNLATAYQKKYRKKKACLLTTGALTVALLVIVLIIVVSSRS